MKAIVMDEAPKATAADHVEAAKLKQKATELRTTLCESLPATSLQHNSENEAYDCLVCGYHR